MLVILVMYISENRMQHFVKVWFETRVILRVILYKKTSPKKAVYGVGGGGLQGCIYWHQNQILQKET